LLFVEFRLFPRLMCCGWVAEASCVLVSILKGLLWAD